MRQSSGILQDAERWIAWVRLLAVPLAFLEVVLERGNYPPGHEPWAWGITAAFAVGALALFRVRGRFGLAALVLDTAVVSAYVVLYGFELGSPVRQLLVLPVLEAALRYGARGGVLWPLATAPALAVFEWRQAVRLDLYPFDVGHVLGPMGIELLVGLTVGLLAQRHK